MEDQTPTYVFAKNLTKHDYVSIEGHGPKSGATGKDDKRLKVEDVMVYKEFSEQGSVWDIPDRF